MRNSLTIAVLLPLLFSTMACGPNVGFRDHDPEVPHVFGERQDALAGTYAEGSTLTFWIKAGRNLGDYTVQSSAPEVLEILGTSTDSDSNLVVDALAVSAGSFDLEVLKPDGKPLESKSLQVERPDTFRLLNRAMSQAGASTEDTEVLDFQMLSNSEVVLVVETSAGGEVLAGNAGITTLDDPEDLFGIAIDTRTGANHPTWVRLTSFQDDGTIPVYWNEELVLEGIARVVDPSVITALSLVGSEDGKNDGEGVFIHAQANDADGNAVLGASADWRVEPSTEGSTSGDLYRYNLDNSVTNELFVSLGDLEARMPISGAGAATDSTNIGCATVSYPGGVFAMLVGLLGLARRR